MNYSIHDDMMQLGCWASDGVKCQGVWIPLGLSFSNEKIGMGRALSLKWVQCTFPILMVYTLYMKT